MAFTVFIISWCVGLVFFPTASLIAALPDSDDSQQTTEYVADASEESKPVEKTKKSKKDKKSKKNKGNDFYLGPMRTVFLNDFNHKQIFVLDGDYSNKQILEHDGSTYLIYFEKFEGSEVTMCARNMDRTLPEPGLPEFFQQQMRSESMEKSVAEPVMATPMN
ncbi:MAG: hypothetical protein KBT11_01950 [Treponema sp.]|nr:hypothetical protein [Candidatus Treponema equifaecale]